MNTYAQATSCPAPPPLSTLAHQNNANARTVATFHHDATTYIDYTAQSKQEILNMKPRRRATRTKKEPAFDPSTDIWLDDAIPHSPQRGRKSSSQHTKDSPSLRSRSRGSKKHTTLAQPPQRIPVPHAPSREDKAKGPRRRRVSALLAEKGLTRSTADSKLNVKDSKQNKKQLDIRKDPRRRTIYVPSDDTTIMTIHPGAYTGSGKTMDLTTNLAALPEETGASKTSVPRESKAARKSITAAPKRAPLQKSSRLLQGASFAQDIVGSGVGKENMPPGLVAKPENKHPNSLGATPEIVKKGVSKPAKFELLKAKKTQAASQLAVATRPQPSRKRKSFENKQNERPSKALKPQQSATPVRAPLGDKTNKNFAASKSPKPRFGKQQYTKPASKLSVPLLVKKIQKVDEKYKVISDDLSSAALYEDNWLNYQETAITQLINKLFDSTDLKSHDFTQEEGALRRMLLSVYQEPAMTVLYKRLQASLMYGALSIPRAILSKAIRLKDDVGLRRKYLNLFVDTYDPFVLAAALEAIVGRQVPSLSQLSSSATSSDGEARKMRQHRKAIQDFLDTFFVRHEDAVRVKTGLGTISSIARGQNKDDDFGSQDWSWRRTVLRSIMLILLLDKSKTKSIFNLPLFQRTSSYKSSNAVLQQLASMLFPSLGDVSRPLSHLNYELKCVQVPLEEYLYRIDNLATDMRDGVMLTRLVEVLLYTPETLSTQKDMRVTMPTGDTLKSTFRVNDKNPWVLSQHLKLPSVGRTQKLFNVQVALSALRGIKGAASRVVKEVTAEHIVDGHREKTLSLLWALVGKWGLEKLVDWAELSKEILRHRKEFYAQNEDNDPSDPNSESEPESDIENEPAEMPSLAKHTARLKAWAHGIARLQGLHVANLTTSFADDRVLEAVVDQYTTCFPIAVSSNSGSEVLSLKNKLKAIGCSDSFICLYTPSSTALDARLIPSKDFTTTTLAFLASRLLPASRAHRAACVIQRWYHLRLARREITRRVILMRLAAHCATVVQTRDKVVGAAVVLQRAWRCVLDARIGRLIGDVLGLQAAARGWAVRKKLAASKAGKAKRRENVRGGW